MKYPKEHIDFAYQKLYSAFDASQTNVFLCGKSTEELDSIRASLQKRLYDSNKINVILPEWFFSSSTGSEQTILEQEHLLAQNVDYVVIVLESAGAICELGAFASSSELLGKILVLIEDKHSHRKSFINQGPIRSIKKTNSNAVFKYAAANPSMAIEEVFKKIVYAQNVIRVGKDVGNIFNFTRLLGFSIGLLQPVSVYHLKATIREWSPGVTVDFVEPALELLSKNGHVSLDTNNDQEVVTLTPEGNSYYLFRPAKENKVTKKVTSIRSENLWRKYKNRSKINLEGELKRLLEHGQ